MKTTTAYAGIDYGLGKTNKDTATGICYGAISQNSLNGDAAQEVFQQGTDLSFEQFRDEAKSKLSQALSDYFSDYKRDGKPSKLDDAVESAFDAIEDDLNDGYQPDNASYRYDRDGLTIETCLDNDFIITKSPYFTHAQFCSPCVPGACNLDSPLESPAESNRCFCLPADWFDSENPCPYVIFSVATGEQLYDMPAGC